jgi:nicotinamide mononucleotide transporter
MFMPLTVLQWLHMHYIELVATITGFLYIVFTIREKMLLWLFGIISSALYAWIFFNSTIYAYSILYVYYVIMGIYGWYNWSGTTKVPGNTSGKLVVHRASSAGLLVYIAVSLIFAIPVYFLLKKYSETDAAWLDALLTSSGMVATWMLTQKIIEQWIFWIAIDLLSFGLMIYKGLYPSSFLFFAYTLLAVKGYVTWKKELTAPKIQ